MLSPTHRPRLRSWARLRWDEREGAEMLISPERGLLLNHTAADVVRLCTGEHTVSEIVERLVEVYGDVAIRHEVPEFLETLWHRALLKGRA